jgi:integrase
MDFNLYFYLRTDKKNKLGEHPLNLFYVFQRKFLKIPVGISLLKNDWGDNQIPSTLHKDFRNMMRKMDLLDRKVRKTINDYQLSYGDYPSTVKLKELLNNNPTPKNIDLNQPDDGDLNHPDNGDFQVLSLFDEFITFSEKDDKRQSTITVYKTTRGHWVEFEKSTNTKYCVSNVNFKLMEDFSVYLKNKNLMFSTVGKNIKTLKTVLNFMTEYKKLTIDYSFKKIKVEREEENNFETFTEEEYQILRHCISYSEYEIDKEKISLNKREVLIGRLMLFMCSTGMSYVDLMNLRSHHIILEKKELKKRNSKTEPELMVYLKYDRQKIKKKTECIVPLHRHTLEILLSIVRPHYTPITIVNMNIPEKTLKQWLDENIKTFNSERTTRNDDDYRLFPKVTNSDFNNEIKLLCEKLEFNELVSVIEKRKESVKKVYRKYECISSHTGRRTYVTLCLKMGIRPDILMKSTGHLKIDTLKRYNKYSTTSIHEEFEKKVLFKNGNS